MEFISGYFAKVFDGTPTHTAKATVAISVVALLISLFALYISYRTFRSGEKKTRREEFDRQLSHRREEHKSQLEKVIRYLDETDPKNNHSGGKWFTELCQKNDHKQAVEFLNSNNRISPYLNVLYDLLKYIEYDFYATKNRYIEQKKDIDSIRSLIPNDVLFLVALNASYVEENSTDAKNANYQRILNKYYFFQKANFFEVNNNQTKPDINRYMEKVFTETNQRFRYIFGHDCKWGSSPQYSLPISFIISCIFINPYYKECLKILSDVPEQVQKAIDKAREERMNDCDRELQIGHMFSDFIDKILVVVSPDRLKEIEQSGTITTYEMDEGRKVTVEFITSLIQENHFIDEKKLTHGLFCWKNQYDTIGYHDYNRLKERYDLYLSWKNHRINLTGDKFNAEIVSELNHWKDKIQEINKHRIGVTMPLSLSYKVKQFAKNFSSKITISLF